MSGIVSMNSTLVTNIQGGTSRKVVPPNDTDTDSEFESNKIFRPTSNKGKKVLKSEAFKRLRRKRAKKLVAHVMSESEEETACSSQSSSLEAGTSEGKARTESVLPTTSAIKVLAPNTSESEDSDLENFVKVAESAENTAHTVDPMMIPESPPKTRNGRHPILSSDSDSSFDRFLEEEKKALANGVRKKATKSKNCTVKGKSLLKKPTVNNQNGQSTGQIFNNSDISDSSDGEFENYIKTLAESSTACVSNRDAGTPNSIQKTNATKKKRREDDGEADLANKFRRLSPRSSRQRIRGGANEGRDSENAAPAFPGAPALPSLSQSNSDSEADIPLLFSIRKHATVGSCSANNLQKAQRKVRKKPSSALGAPVSSSSTNNSNEVSVVRELPGISTSHAISSVAETASAMPPFHRRTPSSSIQQNSVLSLDNSVFSPVVVNSPIRSNPSRSRSQFSSRSPGQRRNTARSRASAASVSASPGLNRETVDNDIMIVSPPSGQMADDEAFARRLQAELDHEFAASLANYSSPAMYGRTGSGRTPQQRQAERELDSETRMLQRIGSLSDYEWQVHEAVYRGDNPPDPLPGDSRSSAEILDLDILEYMRRRRQSPMRGPQGRGPRGQGQRSPRHSTNTRSPTLVSNRTAGRRNTGGRTRAARGLQDELDMEVSALLADIGIPYLAGMPPGRRRARGRRSTATTRQRGWWSDNFGVLMGQAEESYEQLLDLGERIGGVKKGLSQSQLELLPTRPFAPKAGDSAGGSTTGDSASAEAVPECNICFCEYEAGDSIKMLTCFHEFHCKCIDKWLKDNITCPICRVEVQFGSP